ncbi:hypothetical protein BJ322DRAFT_1090300 [Thelephora terrestris]|uniref:Uncharacterized protein n=1 Tax=Thelephora terrestris TaxID=56493 RepID=A0A9P6H4Q7_9AGAM|nr:hypothetical protein BJ322DRAFT_1090300 [Thelephora terrestris]
MMMEGVKNKKEMPIRIFFLSSCSLVASAVPNHFGLFLSRSVPASGASKHTALVILHLVARGSVCVDAAHPLEN